MRSSIAQSQVPFKEEARATTTPAPHPDDRNTGVATGVATSDAFAAPTNELVLAIAPEEPVDAGKQAAAASELAALQQQLAAKGHKIAGLQQALILQAA
jgi:hypothetical protein